MARRTKRWQLYVRIAVMNIALLAMLVTVNVQPPQPVAAAAPRIVAPPQPRAVLAKTGVPKRLSIPSLTLDLKVATGSFNAKTREWKIDTARAFYADVSLPANNSNGVTLIYGHAQAPVFARLPELKKGAALRLTTPDYVFRYAYQKTKQVTPTDTRVFSADGPPTLVLQTCAGAWDTYRALFYFTLVAVERA